MWCIMHGLPKVKILLEGKMAIFERYKSGTKDVFCPDRHINVQ
jgi:hypothetical protein